MLGWVNTHGIEALILGYLFSALVGSMPPLPDTSTYWQKWGYGFLHAAAGNLREAGKLLNIPGLNGEKKDPPPQS